MNTLLFQSEEKCFGDEKDIEKTLRTGNYKGLDTSSASTLLELSHKLQEAPDWLDMGDMNLFMDENGNMYVKDLQRKIQAWKLELEGQQGVAGKEEGGIEVDEGTLVYDSHTHPKTSQNSDKHSGQYSDKSTYDEL